MMLRFLFLVSLGVLCQKTNAQIVNNGAVVFMNQGGVVYFGDNYFHRAGEIINNSNLTIAGNIENRSTNQLFNTTSTGTVKLVGSNKSVGGSHLIVFPNLDLELSGTLNLTNNIEVNQVLDLRDANIFTGVHYVRVNNPQVNSLQFGKGFLNTQGGGSLQRSTNSSAMYFFPLGESSASNVIVVTPDDSRSNLFAINFSNSDASNDGFDRKSKRQDLASVFDKYYYKVAQPAGSSEAMLSFYNNKNSGDLNWVASWVESRIWQKIPEVKVVNEIQPGGVFDRVFQSRLKRSLSVEPTMLTYASMSDTNNPFVIFNAFSPDGDNKNDKWVVNNIEAYPDNDVSIFDRSGNLIYRVVGYNKEKAWDGQNAIQGTYFYVIRAKINGEQRYFKGAITLVKQ